MSKFDSLGRTLRLFEHLRSLACHCLSCLFAGSPEFHCPYRPLTWPADAEDKRQESGKHNFVDKSSADCQADMAYVAIQKSRPFTTYYAVF